MAAAYPTSTCRSAARTALASIRQIVAFDEEMLTSITPLLLFAAAAATAEPLAARHLHRGRRRSRGRRASVLAAHATRRPSSRSTTKTRSRTATAVNRPGESGASGNAGAIQSANAIRRYGCQPSSGCRPLMVRRSGCSAAPKRVHLKVAHYSGLACQAQCAAVWLAFLCWLAYRSAGTGMRGTNVRSCQVCLVPECRRVRLSAQHAT
jgi:hypothetical protein